MHRAYFWAVIAIVLGCLSLIGFSLWQGLQDPAPATKVHEDYVKVPFKTYLTGVGIVEASSEDIFIGAPVSRIVDKVLVTVGQDVQKDTILLRLEDRDLQAELTTRQMAYKIALAQLQKLKAMPRKEDSAVAEAALQSAQLELAQTQAQAARVQGLQDTRAVSQEEINRRQFNYQQAKTKQEQAQAQLDKIQAGTWQPDLDIAHLEVQQAQANVARIEAEIQRTIIRSPIDGKVLQIKIHAGEFPPPDSSQTPLLIVGNTDELYLQVSINQFDASRYRAQAPAVAFLRGNTRRQFPLEFVRLEPYLVSKRNLTNDITEKADTRVLQVMYRFKDHPSDLFIGQQMDVFIATEDRP